MLNVKVWTMSLGCHQPLELVLPGFRWISTGSVLLGLAESFVFGAYLGLLFVPLHNYFARRWAAPVPKFAGVPRV